METLLCTPIFNSAVEIDDREIFCNDQFANLVPLFDVKQPGNSEQKRNGFQGASSVTSLIVHNVVCIS